ncbi:ABC transporter permease [Neorhizobium sp. DT-125]|uniref:ABC transporter permease n=1 Tax=Neorhizobium sp. DT-125 TaxID=3396163 RepID=UPI003F1B8AE7
MAVTELHTGAVATPAEISKSPNAGMVRRVLLTWQGAVGASILAVALFCAIFAPWIVPYSSADIDYMAIMMPPDHMHLFGTDEVGRDILSRCIEGARTSLIVVFSAVAFSAVVGMAIGLVAGWVGGLTEKVLMRVMDAVLAFPLIVLALTIIAILGPSLSNAILAIGIVKIPHFARLTRGEVLSLKELDYIKAMKTLGASEARILLRHILPNSIGPVLVYVSIAASLALMTEASLSFLGLGVQPPTPSWGGMVAVGMQNYQFWWMSIFPGLAIFLTVFAFNLLGDAIRDAVDARLQ